MRRNFKRSFARLSAAVLFSILPAITGCTKSGNPVSANPSAGAKLFVVGSNYQSGILQWMGTKDSALAASYLQVYEDSYLKQHNGMLYVLEAMGADNVMKVNPSTANMLYEKHLGTNWNPVDIQFVSEQKAYVACESHAAIAIINPSTGSMTGSIDISRYGFKAAGQTSNPHAYVMAMDSSNRLYVGLEMLDTAYAPALNSLVLVISTASDSIIDTVQCNYKNLQDMKITNGKLYVSNIGAWGTIGDGAIESIDLSTHAVATVISESSLHGDPLQMEHKTGSVFYVGTYISWTSEKVYMVDFSSGAVVDSVPSVVYANGGICYDAADSLLFVGERDAAGKGVKVYRNNVLVHAPIANGASLPPYSLVLVN